MMSSWSKSVRLDLLLMKSLFSTDFTDNHFSSDIMNGVRRTLNSQSAGLCSLGRAHGKVIALKSLSRRNFFGRTRLFKQSSVPLASVGLVSIGSASANTLHAD